MSNTPANDPQPTVNTITYCGTDAALECPKKWDALTPTDEANVRYCAVCQKDVILCSSWAELTALVRRQPDVRAAHPVKQRTIEGAVSRPKPGMRKLAHPERAAKLRAFIDSL